MPNTKATYPTRQLGKNGPTVSAIGFGAMGIGSHYGQTDLEEAFKTLSYAVDRGITFFDTADIYGTSQEILGQWFQKTGRRNEVFLATKFGAMDLTPGVANPYKQNSKPSYIRRQFQNSLSALQTDYIDLYYQHRVDPEVPIEIVMETLREFVDRGQIRWIGLSECSAEVLRRAKAVPGVGDKVIAAQMEYSLVELGHEKSGFVKAAQELGVSIVAYSPLGRGLLTGRFRSRADFEEGDLRLMLPRFSEENFSKNLVLVDKVAEIAARLGSTASQVALAWILAEYPDFVPIPGSRSIERLEDNAKGAELKLSEEDVREIRRLAEEADVQGGRYPEVFASSFQTESLPLSEWKGEN